MEEQLLTTLLKGAAGDAPWMIATIYLFRENQALHKQIAERLAKYLELYQKALLKASENTDAK